MDAGVCEFRLHRFFFVFFARLDRIGSGYKYADTIYKVYRCQKKRMDPKCCNFFLWDDDARPREMAAVSSNSITDPSVYAAPQTPHMNRAQGPMMTPENSDQRSGPNFRHPETTPYTPSKSTGHHVPLSARSPNGGAAAQNDDDDPNEEFYDVNSGDEEEFFQSGPPPRASNRAMPPPETPRKAAKTSSFPTPGKRTHDEMARDEPNVTTQPSSSPATLLPDGDVFTTPSAATAPRAPNLFSTGNGNVPSLTDTSATQRFHDPLSPGSGQDSDIATEQLNFLTIHNASPEVKDRIRAIANRHSRHTLAVTRGRDVSRTQIAHHKETIVKLQGDIAALQAERATNKAVIGLLTRELETATKDQGGR